MQYTSRKGVEQLEGKVVVEAIIIPSLTPIGVLVTDFNIIVDFSRVTVYYKF